MFTGIIESVGTIVAIERGTTDARVRVRIVWAADAQRDVVLGDSVAINGTCLTVVAIAEQDSAVNLDFDASHETLALTSLGGLSSGSAVNIERALCVGDRLGGHWVTGHVDGVGALTAVKRTGDAWDLSYRMPKTMEPEVVHKGSICIDGVSLTVNRVWPEHFAVTLIAHTVAHTQLLDGGVGKQVNLESDIIGKYVRRLVSIDSASSSGKQLDLAALRKAGFAS